MRKAIIAFLLLFGSADLSFAQSMQLGPGQVVANPSGAQRPGGATSLTVNGLLGSAAAYQVTNPGNAAILGQIPNPPGGYTTLYNGPQFCQGACVPAAQQFGANNIPIRQGLVGTTSIPVGEVTVQAHGLAGYALANVGNGTFTNFSGTYSTGNVVGVHGWGGTTVANANVFGANFIAVNTNGDQNSIGKDVNYMAAMELDLLVWQKSPGVDPVITNGHAYGLTIAGSSNLAAKITNSSAIVVDRMSVQTNVPWDFGFSTYGGATVNAVVAGPATNGINSDSQYIAFQYSDGAGAAQIGARIKGDTSRNLLLVPGAGAVVSLQDGTGVSLLNTSSTFGASKVRIPAFTVAGMVTNDATTGQLNSVTTLPSGLTAPSLTVTTAFTATGLVTNADLVNAATTVNGQVCTLGSTCSITAGASSLTVGGTLVTSGTTTRVLFDNAGVLGEYVISGTGNVAMTTNAVFTTPNLGTPSALTLTNATGLPTTGLTGTLQAAQEPAHTGDVTNTAGSLALTLATAQPAVHTWALAQTFTVAPVFTDASGSRTALGLGALATVTPGTGVATALAVNIGTAGSFVTNGGALGTPSSGVGTNITNVNAATLGGATFAAPGAIGGGTPSTGAFTTLSASTSVTSPLHVGGSGTTQALTYKTTTGIGASGADHIFLAGNNGALQPARFYNSGAASLGGSLDKGAIGQVSVQGTAISGVYIKNTVDGTGNLGTVDIQNSTGGVELSIGANEPSRSVALFGITLGNWASIIDIGTNGLLIGEFANAPVAIGTNNLERVRVSGAGCLGVGTTTDCGAANFLVAGHLLASGTAPTVSSCGVSPTIAGGDNFGTVTAGTGILTSCVINFAKTWGATPRCVASSNTAIASMTTTATTTQLTIGGTSLTSDIINWICGATA